MKAGPLRYIRVRLTLWYVLLLAALLAVFSLTLYFAMRRALDESLLDSLNTRYTLVVALVTTGGAFAGAEVAIPGDALEGEHFTRVFDATGVLLFDNAVPEHAGSIDEEAVDRALAGSRTIRHIGAGDEDLRALVAPVEIDGVVVGAVEVAQSEQDMKDTLRLLLIIIAVAYPLTLLAATVVGVWLAGRALSPIDSLTRTARQITAADLTRRIETSGPDDEVGRLARTLDEMIERLDAAFRRQRQFTSDASHELRTPLTSIRGQIEVALDRERDPAHYRQVLGAVNDEVDRLVRLVGSLLVLARADAGGIPIERDSVNLGELVESVVAQVQPVAEEKRIRLSARGEPETHLLADEDLLLQLVLNLLDNALKYSPEGSAIEVTWGMSGEHATLAVSDTGPGIAAEHIGRIFDRFYRVERSRSTGGTGLGLSICRWIAEAHGGSIEVRSEVGAGTVFTVRLPSRTGWSAGPSQDSMLP